MADVVVVPTRRFRRLVHPRRDNPLAPPGRADPKRALVTAFKAWQTVRNHWGDGWSHRKDARVELERAADAVIQASELPRALDLDVLAAAERMLTAYGTLLPAVADRHGPRTAIAVKMRSLAWAITNGRDKQRWWWLLSEPTNIAPPAVDSGWNALRVALSAADSATYAEARDDAARRRADQPDPVARVPLDFAFPGEEPWSRDDMKAILALPTFAKVSTAAAPLFGSLVDEGLCLQFLAQCAWRQCMSTLRYACDLVAGMPPEAATRVLLRQMELTFEQRHYEESQLSCLTAALTSVVSETMARGLARYVRAPRYGRHFIEYFEQHGELARVVLATDARGKSVAGDEARYLIAAHDRVTEPDVGSVADAPALLANPPWTARPPRPVLALETLPYGETITWAEGERERTCALPAINHHTATIRPMEPAELAEHDALTHKPYVDVWPRWFSGQWTVLELPDDRRLRLWDSTPTTLYFRPPCFMLAMYGERALAGLFARGPFETQDDRMITATLRVDSPRAALVCSRVLARRRPWRVRARAWLVAHAEASAIGLMPVALGRDGRVRRTAERALRYVAWTSPDVVRRVAERYGPAAKEAVESRLFPDRLARLDVRGNPPRWLRVDALPLVRSRDGKPLPRAIVRTLVDVLRARGEDVPYAGMSLLREGLDPASLDRFAWALFMGWAVHGRRRVHEWMAMSLVAFGGDDIVSRLSRYTRDWAQSDPRACITLVDVLAQLGTEEARLELLAVAELARAPVLLEALKDVAPTADALHRIDLDERGEATLDLGSRRVRVVLDEELTPRVVLEDGRHVNQVPRPRKGDDPKLATNATAQFNRLRREAKTVAAAGLRKLERDMVSGRALRMSDFHTLARHPLLGHAVRRLVWEARGGEPIRFRVAEDGSYTGDRDLPLEIDPEATIVLIHPLFLDDQALARWGTLLADYEIVQPFDQLGRITFRGTIAMAQTLFAGLSGAMVEARALLKTLELHGWERPAGARVAGASREVPCGTGTTRVYLSFAPGITLAQVRKAPAQKLGPMRINPPTVIEGLSPVVLSEIVRTALTLRS